MQIYIGLMSGTSVDAIDVAAVDFSSTQPRLIASLTYPYPAELRQQVLALCQPGANEINRMGATDIALGKTFSAAVLELLNQAKLSAKDIIAIGCHGQTIRHQPETEHPFSLQIGDANQIAHRTGITTVADFRRRDMAAGGQGAPLVPAFHQAILSSPKNPRWIVNIGGMANITALPIQGSPAPVIGFDTGPGNVLMDAWIHQQLNQPFDRNGDWANSGKIIAPLLKQLLAHEYFRRPPPKSTGRELFHLDWLEQQLKNFPHTAAENIQATLLAFTAETIALGIRMSSAHTVGEVILCGGGTHNSALKNYLNKLLSPLSVITSDVLGINSDHMEAMAFTWLAKQTLEQQSGNLPSVTGAEKPVILGAIYWGHN